MTRTRTMFLLSLGLLLLTGFNIFRPLLPLSSFWQGLAFGVTLGAAITHGWYLFRGDRERAA